MFAFFVMIMLTSSKTLNRQCGFQTEVYNLMGFLGFENICLLLKL